MLTLLTSLALAQDVDPFGESLVETAAVVNPEAVAEQAAAEQALLDSFYTEAPETSSSVAGIDTSWAWVGGFLLIGVAFAARKKLGAKITKKAKETAQLEVVARHGLGHGTGLVMLDCKTGDGGSRRILVGISQNASPTLVADLGGDIPGFTELVETPTATETPTIATVAEEVLAKRVPDHFDPPRREARTTDLDARPSTPEVHGVQPEDTTPRPKRALVGRFTEADLAPLDEAPLPAFDGWKKTAAPQTNLSDHLSLVDEVLSGRQVWERVAG